MSNAVATITNEVYAMRGSFNTVIVDRSVNFEREAGFAIQAITSGDYIMKVALGNPQSVRDAVTNIAAIGISLNPAKKQAYLVPRKNKICLDISYMGLMDLAMETGSIKWAQANLVYKNDTFASNGLDKPPLHSFDPFSKDRGELVGVYVTVKTADGEYLTDTMSIDEVYAIRDRSESWKKDQSGPWKTDQGEMIKKTVVKRAYKYWPKTERLESAIHYLNTDGGEGITFTQEPEKKCEADVLSAYVNQAKAAQTPEALTKIWKEGVSKIKATGDLGAYNEFKAQVAIRGEFLESMKIDAVDAEFSEAQS
jgi:recombination protein RecT